MNLFLHLKKGLEQRSFLQSEIDSCPFFNGKIICLVYVDDCLFFARKTQDIDKIISDLKTPKEREQKRCLLDEEDDVAGFLGTLFEKIINKKGETTQIKLTQTGLIKSFLAVTGLEECASVSTPAQIKALKKDEEGDPTMKNGALPLW